MASPIMVDSYLRPKNLFCSSVLREANLLMNFMIYLENLGDKESEEPKKLICSS